MPLVSVWFLFVVLEIRKYGLFLSRTWKAIAQRDAKIYYSAPTSNAPHYSSGTNVPALSMQPTSILAACTYAYTCAKTLSCQSKVSDPMHKLVSWNAVALAQPPKNVYFDPTANGHLVNQPINQSSKHAEQRCTVAYSTRQFVYHIRRAPSPNSAAKPALQYWTQKQPVFTKIFKISSPSPLPFYLPVTDVVISSVNGSNLGWRHWACAIWLFFINVGKQHCSFVCHSTMISDVVPTT